MYKQSGEYNFEKFSQPHSDDWPPYGVDMYPYPVTNKGTDTPTEVLIKKVDRQSEEDDDNRSFPSGAQRDTAESKPRMSLIPQEELKRVMRRYLDGAEKYGENNWMKGMPLSVYYDCAQRHLEAWWNNKDDEDHAAAAVWNMLCAMWTEQNVAMITADNGEFLFLDDRYKFPRGSSNG